MNKIRTERITGYEILWGLQGQSLASLLSAAKKHELLLLKSVITQFIYDLFYFLKLHVSFSKLEPFENDVFLSEARAFSYHQFS